MFSKYKSDSISFARALKILCYILSVTAALTAQETDLTIAVLILMKN